MRDERWRNLKRLSQERVETEGVMIRSSFSCKAATNVSSGSGSRLCSRARSSLEVVSVSHGSRRGYNRNRDNSARCALLQSPILPSCFLRRCWSVQSASLIASSSSSSSGPCVVSNFGSTLASVSSFRGLRALHFDEGRQNRRGSTQGGSLLLTWRRVSTFTSRTFAWWSTRKASLDSSGHGVGLQQGFCLGRADLVVMAASEGVPEQYRPNVGLCLVNDKDEVFVASRLDIPDAWQMPQGGVDDGEDPRDAAIRELREETGVTTVQLIGEVPQWLTYDFPPDVKTKISVLWGTEWKGQAQKWFLFRFAGDESEITLEGDGSEKPEFGDWKWLPPEEVVKSAVEFKRPVYAQVFKALAVYIESWSKL